MCLDQQTIARLDKAIFSHRQKTLDLEQEITKKTNELEIYNKEVIDVSKHIDIDQETIERMGNDAYQSDQIIQELQIKLREARVELNMTNTQVQTTQSQISTRPPISTSNSRSNQEIWGQNNQKSQERQQLESQQAEQQRLEADK